LEIAEWNIDAKNPSGVVNHWIEATWGLMIVEVFCRNGILSELRPDVRMEPFSIHDEDPWRTG